MKTAELTSAIAEQPDRHIAVVTQNTIESNKNKSTSTLTSCYCVSRHDVTRADLSSLCSEQLVSSDVSSTFWARQLTSACDSLRLSLVSLKSMNCSSSQSHHDATSDVINTLTSATKDVTRCGKKHNIRVEGAAAAQWNSTTARTYTHHMKIYVFTWRHHGRMNEIIKV